MSATKTFRRKKRRVANRQPKRATNNTSQACIDNPSNVTALANEQADETAQGSGQDEISVEATELLDSLMQFAVSENEVSPPQSEEAPDSFTQPEAMDDSVSACEAGALSESGETEKELVDPSNWFVSDDGDFLEESNDDSHTSPAEERFSNFAFTPAQERAPDEETVEEVYFIDSSTITDADKFSDQTIDKAPAQMSKQEGDERRKEERNDASHLVWVEYFDSSMQCVGKEVARTENVGEGGMRLCVKAAPPGIERISVSHSYRGFESYALVRNRYSNDDGHDRLCLEFVDKEWNVHATSALESNADQVRPRRILFAEDDPAFRKIIGKILTGAGYDVVLAEDGESAVEKAAMEKPDLVITDGLMPKLNGFHVCKAIKELDPAPKVILLTAVYTNPSYTWEARTNFGADDIITKPCEIAYLLRRIEKHMPSEPQQVL